MVGRGRGHRRLAPRLERGARPLSTSAMTASHILRTKGSTLHTLSANASLAEAAARLARHDVGALLVMEGDALTGILSERDVVRALAKDGALVLARPVRSEMTADVETCSPDTSVRALMARMTVRRIRHLPVLDAGRVVGIVSIGDVVNHRVREIEAEAAVLQDALTLRRAAALVA